MGYIGSLLGTRGGNQGGAGMNFDAQGIPIQQGTNTAQVGQTFDKAQSGIDQQQAFVNALQAQGAPSQQLAALQAQQALQAQATAQGGLANQSSVFNQQQALANQLQGVANGTGPNPAAASLANATAANTANQAALMAGQRGASANAGLIARQAAQQGAANQQNAIGQSAVLQANQQLAGMNALQNQQAALGNTAGAQVGNAFNANNAVSNMTGQLVGQQANAIQGYNQASQSEQQNLLNSLNAQNNSGVSMQGNINSANAGVAGKVADAQQSFAGGLMNGGAAALMADGGMVPVKKELYAQGGPVAMPMDPSAGPQSNAGKFLYSSAPSNNTPGAQAAPLDMGTPGNGTQTLNQGANKMGSAMSSSLQSMLSGSGGSGAAASGSGMSGLDSLAEAAPMAALAQGGPVMLASEGAGLSMSKGGKVKKPINGEMLAAKGKEVPGKAKVKGNSYANDTVDAKLSPGEVVIPRSIMQSSDPINNAAKFVASVLAKKGRRLG